MTVKKGALVREGGEVGLGSAAADSVVGRSPGWGEPGSVRELEYWREEGVEGRRLLG